MGWSEVRPPSGAAVSEFETGLEILFPYENSAVAAPEDGRTPVRGSTARDGFREMLTPTLHPSAGEREERALRPAILHRHQTVADGVSGQRGDVVGAQFDQDVLAMGFHRLGADLQERGDALRVLAVREVAQDLTFPAG